MNDPFKQATANRKVLTAGEDAGGRIDAYLTDVMAGEFSRSRIKALIEQGFRMISYGGDLWLYQAALRAGIEGLRQGKPNLG